VGVLYIIATAAGVLQIGPLGSLFEGTDMLDKIAAHSGSLVLSSVLQLIMSIAVAAVALMIYPLLKQDADTVGKKGLAAWYVGTRITEGTTFLIVSLAMLLLVTLGREFVNAGSPDASYFQTAGILLKMTTEYASMLAQSVFCIGALMLYALLYQSRRIPRWLSGWGFIAAPLMLAAGFLILVDGDPNSPFSTALYAPMALQEMVFALWLIFRGWGAPARTK